MYGPNGSPDFSSTSHSLAYCLHGASQGDDDLYVMVNLYWEDVTFHLQEPGPWVRAIETSRSSPDDIVTPGSEVPLQRVISVKARSIQVALRKGLV